MLLVVDVLKTGDLVRFKSTHIATVAFLKNRHLPFDRVMQAIINSGRPIKSFMAMNWICPSPVSD